MNRTVNAVCMAVALAFAGTLAFPEPAHASFWKKVKKTAKKATKAVSHAAKDAVDELDDLTEVDDIALDATTTIGKEVKKAGNQTVMELKDGKDVVGHIYVEGGKIVATEYNDGKKLVKEVEKGPKYLVKGGEIVGQEVVRNGKVVGNTIIKNGKVIGVAAVAGGEYVVEQGMLVLKEINSQICKMLVSAAKEAKKFDTKMFPELPGRLSKAAKDAEKLGKGITSKASDTIGYLGKQIDPLDDVMTEVMRIAGEIDKKQDSIKALFTPGTLCDSSAAQLQAKLEGLGLKPKLPGRGLAMEDFFISSAHAAGGDYWSSFSLLLSSMAAPYAGSGALTIATNFKGQTGVFLSGGVGLTMVRTIGAGLAYDFVGVQKKLEFKDFKGLSHQWSVTASSNAIPKLKDKLKNANFGVNFGFNETHSQLDSIGVQFMKEGSDKMQAGKPASPGFPIGVTYQAVGTIALKNIK